MQQEFFPKTELDDANAVLNKLIADAEKAEKACGTADEKLSTIQWLIQRQRRVIAHLASEMPAAEPAQEAEASDVEEAEYETLAIEGDVLDPETGEVASKAERRGEAISQTPHVLVYWPGDLLNYELRRVEVGEHTRYGELVADYLTEIGSAAEVTAFRVVEYADRSPRDLDAVIVPADYGLMFEVELAPASEEELAEQEANLASEPAA